MKWIFKTCSVFWTRFRKVTRTFVAKFYERKRNFANFRINRNNGLPNFWRKFFEVLFWTKFPLFSLKIPNFVCISFAQYFIDRKSWLTCSILYRLYKLIGFQLLINSLFFFVHVRLLVVFCLRCVHYVTLLTHRTLSVYFTRSSK